MPRKVKNIYVDRLNEWADALESGNWQQCVGRLALPNTRKTKCPLGVACHLSGLGEWKAGIYVCGPKDKEGSQLPKAVMEYYGLTDPLGADIMKTVSPGLAAIFPSLAAFNDYPHFMEETADIIRKYAKKVELRG